MTITNKVFSRNGVPVVNAAGAMKVRPNASAPNAVDLGETISLTLDLNSNERLVSLVLPDADYSDYSKVIVRFVGDDLNGDRASHSYEVDLTGFTGGTIELGYESVVLGPDLIGTDPLYETLVVDTSNRVGFSRGLFEFNPDAFEVLNLPFFNNLPLVEGDVVSVVSSVYRGGSNIVVTSSFERAKDENGLDAETVVLTDNEVPEIADGFNYLAYVETFTGTGENLPFVARSSYTLIEDSVAPPSDSPTYSGGLVDLVLQSGEAWTIDWDNFFAGATSYTVNTGLTGGVSSDGNNTNDVYTVASLTGESVTFSVTASNAFGSINRTFNVEVVTPGVAPGLASAIPDVVVPLGSSVFYNATPHFAGSTLSYYSPDDDSNFAITTNGQFKSLVPLTSIIPSENREIVAWNAVGTTLGSNPIATTNASSSVVVTWASHTLTTGDWLGVTGATAVGGITLNGAYKVLSTTTNTITINARTNASSTATGGGAAVVAQEAAYDTIAVEVTATPSLAVRVDEIDVVTSAYRYADTWRAPQARLPGATTLTSNPFSFTSGSSTVTVSIPEHGLVTGDSIFLSGATAAAGLTLAGEYEVTAVPNKDSVRVTASGNASSTTTGGGSLVLYTKPQITETLGTNPFSFTNASSTVTVTWVGHSVGVGRVVEFSGATIAANLIIDGAYLVISAPTADTFTIDAGSTANATTTGGGSAVVATLRNHNQPITLGTNPLTTTDSSAVVSVNAPNHMLAIGRPFNLSGIATVGGIAANNLNGDRTVLAVTDNDNFTFTAGGTASSTSGGGGSAGIIKPKWYGIRWSRNTPDANGQIPDTNSEETPNAWQEIGNGLWETHMENSSLEGNPSSQSPRTDYSVWNTEASDVFRLSYKETPTSLWSRWSGEAKVVPVPTIVVPATVDWVLMSSRFKESYDNNDPDSMGLQFQRVMTWYQGTNPDKYGWVMGGQDENSIRISKDYGRTWTSPPLPGMYAGSMSGIYFDDDAALFVGSSFATGGEAGMKERAGLYIADPDLTKAYKVNATRPSSTYGWYVSGSSGVKQGFAKPMHGNSARHQQNCIGRRPNFAGATNATRPVWIVENTLNTASNVVEGVYIWKLILGPNATVSSITMVRELTPTTNFTNGDQWGVWYVRVAPNGDVMLIHPKGVHLSTDQFATAPTQIYSGAPIADGHFVGGTSTTRSGAIIGRESGVGGVYTTTNVSTTAFTKPTGAGGAANAGMPANYPVWQMGVSGNTVAVVGKAVVPQKSTDLGRNWTDIDEPWRLPNSYNWRYRIRGVSHAGFYPCPNNNQYWAVPTSQTMEMSSDGLNTIDPTDTTFFDGMHDKGWGFSRTDWKIINRNCQDTCLNTGLDGANWTQHNGICSTGNDTFRSQMQTNNGVTGKGFVSANNSLHINNNRVICAMNNNTASYPNLPILLETRKTNGEYTTYEFLKTGNSNISRCFRSGWSPKESDVGFLGRWCVSNVDAADSANIVLTDVGGREFVDCALSFSGSNKTLGNNPVTTTNGSSTVTINLTGHGLVQYQAIDLVGLTAVGGISAGNLNGPRTVASVINANSFTITAGASASSGATGGGSGGSIHPALVSFWGTYGGDTGSAIFRSIEDRATNRATFGSPSVNYVSKSICMDRHHPTLERVLYANGHNIYEMKRVGTSYTQTLLVNLRTMQGGVIDWLEDRLGTGVTIPDYDVSTILCDPFKPGLFYATGGKHGQPNWWQSDDNGTTWYSIQGKLPTTIYIATMHPHTGDVIASTSLGPVVRPPPADYPSFANKGAFSRQLIDFYNRVGIQPPVF